MLSTIRSAQWLAQRPNISTCPVCHSQFSRTTDCGRDESARKTIHLSSYLISVSQAHYFQHFTGSPTLIITDALLVIPVITQEADVRDYNTSKPQVVYQNQTPLCLLAEA